MEVQIKNIVIQKPNPEILEISQEFLHMLNKINFKKTNPSKTLISDSYIGNLCTDIGFISPDQKVLEVYYSFNHNPKCFGVCVVENEKVVGIVTREKLLLKLSGRYDFSLNKNKKISKIMDKKFLTVDYKTPINVVANMAISREDDKLYDFIVVTEKDKYIGIVNFKDLLKKIS